MYQKPKGTRDILPQDSVYWQLMENTARGLCDNYNIKEVRVPLFEDVNVFLRSVGESSDIVNKEMYIFQDRGGRTLALRPEGTAGVVRACVENGLLKGTLPLKLWYIGSNFRYENPQAGRNREFAQFGVEYFGAQAPSADVECICILKDFLDKLNIKDYELELNSIGCPTCRANYNKALKEYVNANLDSFCEDCQRRVKTNPLRILDCKEEKCKVLLQNAPKIQDYLCDECKEHFNAVQNLLNALNIKYTLNNKLVRGLDYYTKTVFEFIAKIDGKAITLGGGGRYDNLVSEFDGGAVPGCGFAIGLDRVIYLIDKQLIKDKDLIYIANTDTVGMDKVVPLVQLLRSAGLNVDMNLLGRSFKAQMKYIDKINARFAIILGDNEINNGVFTVKNLRNGQQCAVPAKELIKYLTLTDEEMKNIIKYADF